MADHRITDFVDKDAIESLKKLGEEMVKVKDTYVEVAKELVKGLSLKIGNISELETATQNLSRLESQAAENTRKLTEALEHQKKMAVDTTASISRKLDVADREYQATRAAYAEQQKVDAFTQRMTSSYDKMINKLNSLNESLALNKEAQKELNAQWNKGNISAEEMIRRQNELVKQERMLKQEKSTLTVLLRNEEKQMLATEGSYAQMSQQLEMMKKAYKEMTKEQRESAEGRELQEMIKNLNAELKDMDQSFGDFHRNVGNYAIACNNGVISTEDLNRVLGLHADTVAGCIEQNKALEQAKANLDTRDASYGATIDRINSKINENKQRITDIDNILRKDATTVAEAEAQNKQLAEALKLIDLRSADAAKRISEINAKIAQNKRIIESATPALRDHANASAGLVDQLGSLVGINTRFGSSLQSLGEASKYGSVIDGLSTKVKAFGKTLMGLLANPYVLAIIGIAGVGAAFKWWYDYNKGLIEATKLTRDFTGASGDGLDSLISRITTICDLYGKDYKEVLNAADKMAVQFGVSYEMALSTISEGFRANADAQGNFLQQINQYAPTLRDAGVSAREFVAILNQTKSGAFGEESIKGMQKAADILKRMPKAAAESLDAIGISSKKLQKDLNDGTITMMEAIQMVAGKIKELPDNSKAAGDAMFNIFGKKAVMGGKLAIEAIADVNTNLDEEIAKQGKLGELIGEQQQAQRELNDTLMSLFKASGTSFEEMTVMAKTFVTKGLVEIINKGVDVVNWFIRMYNKSRLFRSAIESIIAVTRTLIWYQGKLRDAFLAAGEILGNVIEGVLTFDYKKLKQGLDTAKTFWKDTFSEIEKIASDTMGRVLNPKEIKELSTALKSDGTMPDTDGGTGGTGGGGTDEKTIKEQLKILQELEDAKVKAMAEGHEKDLAQIRLNYKKRLDQIKGNGENEQALRLALIAQMQADLDKCEDEYQKNRAKIDLDNRLATVKKNSAEEFALKMSQLEANYLAEIKEAEKTGADVALIEEKYEQQRAELRETYAGHRIKDIEDRYAGEMAAQDAAYEKQLARLKQKLNNDLAAVGANAAEREEIQRRYEDEVAELTEQHAQDAIQTTIDMYHEILQAEDMSTEQRTKMMMELYNLQIQIEQAKADSVEASNQRILDSDARTTAKRIEKAQEWLKYAADSLNAIAGLASAINQAQIQAIEEKIEANAKAMDDEEARNEQEQERITELIEKKVISEEEGEARKRAAESKTAQKRQQIEKKNQELEKQKAQLQYKQAVWDKANSVAQAGIATALAITQALPNIPLVAIVSALGALQLATILATPIPKYKSGTDYHKGGLAIVGDGGKAEVVLSNGEYFVTPDSPTLVDIPKGAKVYPDVDRFVDQAMAVNATIVASGSRESTSVNVDLTRIERKIDERNDLLKSIAYQQKRQGKAVTDALYLSDFEKFKLAKL